MTLGVFWALTFSLNSYIRALMLLELLLTAGSIASLHLTENSESLCGEEIASSLTLLTLTGTEAVFGLSLLILAQLNPAPLTRIIALST